jgi:hypothetical protein
MLLLVKSEFIRNLVKTWSIYMNYANIFLAISSSVHLKRDQSRSQRREW